MRYTISFLHINFWSLSKISKFCETSVYFYEHGERIRTVLQCKLSELHVGQCECPCLRQKGFATGRKCVDGIFVANRKNKVLVMFLVLKRIKVTCVFCPRDKNERIAEPHSIDVLFNYCMYPLPYFIGEKWRPLRR